MSNLVGMVTFGNLSFTKLTVRGIRETTTEPYTIYVVVGQPGDVETINWLISEDIPHIVHDRNYGFPASINDIYDYAWKENNFTNLVIIGNDVVPYPYAIDSLIEIANTTDYKWICSRQLDAKALVSKWPKIEHYFKGASLIFSDFEARPWEQEGIGYSKEVQIGAVPLSDTHNLALYKKDVMDTIGYIDVSFYPAYYSDNDYVRRAVHAEIKSCTAFNSIYFHFWSRTIHQGSGGSNTSFFKLNKQFYATKWGADFGEETYSVPFNGQQYNLGGVTLEPSIKIDSREYEEAITNHWKSRAR